MTAVHKPQTDNLTVKSLAKIAYSAARAYLQETAGDYTLLDWDKVDARTQEEFINRVKYLLANPGCPPSALHNQWFVAMTRAGWRWGELLNPKEKTHPRLWPFEELPTEIQMKDKLFVRLVQALTE